MIHGKSGRFEPSTMLLVVTFNGFIFFHVPFASGTSRAIISAEFFFVVSVAQRVELWIVAPAAGGSNPLAHPIPPKPFP